MEATFDLFDRLLNNLDDLFDGKCSAEDTRAVMAAAASELAGTPWEPVLTDAVEKLGPVVHADDAQDQALGVTDDLRLLLADEAARLEGEIISANRSRIADAHLVGLYPDAARDRVERLGLRFRIGGQPEPHFSWDPRRVTVEVSDGVVRKAHVG